MRCLFIGDIVGRSGREAVRDYLPVLKEKLTPDIVIANVDNAAHGFGVTEKSLIELRSYGVDIFTGGNHIWDQREIVPYIGRDKTLLRPANYPSDQPGEGSVIFNMPDGRKVLILHFLGQLFLDTVDDPFRLADQMLTGIKLGAGGFQLVFVDFHAEATSEKMALAHYLDGRVSAVVGTHTHIPTADILKLPKGTLFQADAGMTGHYLSVIGFKPEIAIARIMKKVPSEKLQPSDEAGALCGMFFVTDDQTGLALSRSPVRMGPDVSELVPAF